MTAKEPMPEKELVGYKSPPKSTRFRPGTSGNPSGRPKKQKTVACEILDELNQLTNVRLGGRSIEITKAKAVANALVQLAIDQDLRAINMILSMSASSDEATENSTTSDDQEVVDRFLEREIRRAKSYRAKGCAVNKTTINILRRDFLEFARLALRELNGTEISDDRYLELLASELMNLADGSVKRQVINLPPRHLKTSLCSIAFAAWTLAQNAEEKVLVVSYAQELAENIARSIRTILQAPWFRKVFRTRIARGRAKVNNFATTEGGELYAVSIDGSVTGFGANLIIVDDPHNLTDARSYDRLERTIERFWTILVPRLNDPKKGRILVVGHRVHENDLSADLLASGTWRHLALPIIATKNQSYVTKFGPWKRKKGELLRRDSYELAILEELRHRLVNPSFDMHYQQDSEAQAFPALAAEHFRFFDAKDVKNLPHFISVDPGTSDDDERSFSVAHVWASDGLNYYLVDEFRKRCDFVDFEEAIRRLAKRYRGAPILIENTANGPALFSALTRKQRRRAYAIAPRDSKTTRFRRHLEKLLAGRVHILKGAPFVEKFVKELTEFPHGRDDQVDAMTQLFDWLEKNNDIDFSQSNCERRGIAARGSDYRLSRLPRRSPSTDQKPEPVRGLAVVAKPQIYNPPFAEVKARVIY